MAVRLCPGMGGIAQGARDGGALKTKKFIVETFFMISRQILVSGSVQGVFFRESTRQIAGELMLSGFVRNLRDGRVEVHVIGDEANIQSLIKWLKIGPKLAKVSTIRVLEMKISPDLLSQRKTGHFEIWPTT